MSNLNTILTTVKQTVKVDSRVWKLFKLLTDAKHKAIPVKFTTLWKLFWDGSNKAKAQCARKLLLREFPQIQGEFQVKNNVTSNSHGGSRPQKVIEYYLDYDQAYTMALVFATSASAIDILKGYEVCRDAITQLLMVDYNKVRSEANLRDKLCSLMVIAGVYGLTAEKEYLNGKRRIDIVIKPCKYITCIELKAKKVSQEVLNEQLAKWYPDQAKIVIVAPSFDPELSHPPSVELKTVRQFVDELREKREKQAQGAYSLHDFNQLAQEITTIFS